MNLWLRLTRIWLGAMRRPPLGVRDTSVITLRIWPHDLDLWGHVNGGRYLTLSDLGRVDLLVRVGFFRLVRRHGWSLPIAAAAVRYRRPLRLFQRCELHTRLGGWDDHDGYMITDVVRGGKVAATIVIRGVAQDRDGAIIPAQAILDGLGMAGEAFPPSDEVRALVGSGR